jgi:hypothetical protein
MISVILVANGTHVKGGRVTKKFGTLDAVQI